MTNQSHAASPQGLAIGVMTPGGARDGGAIEHFRPFKAGSAVYPPATAPAPKDLQ